MNTYHLNGRDGSKELWVLLNLYLIRYKFHDCFSLYAVLRTHVEESTFYQHLLNLRSKSLLISCKFSRWFLVFHFESIQWNEETYIQFKQIFQSNNLKDDILLGKPIIKSNSTHQRSHSTFSKQMPLRLNFHPPTNILRSEFRGFKLKFCKNFAYRAVDFFVWVSHSRDWLKSIVDRDMLVGVSRRVQQWYKVAN